MVGLKGDKLLHTTVRSPPVSPHQLIFSHPFSKQQYKPTDTKHLPTYYALMSYKVKDRDS